MCNMHPRENLVFDMFSMITNRDLSYPLSCFEGKIPRLPYQYNYVDFYVCILIHLDETIHACHCVVLNLCNVLCT